MLALFHPPRWCAPSPNYACQPRSHKSGGSLLYCVRAWYICGTFKVGRIPFRGKGGKHVLHLFSGVLLITYFGYFLFFFVKRIKAVWSNEVNRTNSTFHFQVRHHHQPVGDGGAVTQAGALGGGHGVRRKSLRFWRRQWGGTIGRRAPVLRAAERRLELHRVAHDRWVAIVPRPWTPPPFFLNFTLFDQSL